MVSSASTGTAWTFTIHATDAGVRQCFSPTLFANALQFSISFARAYNAPHIAEG
jgi:hypothetical protein